MFPALSARPRLPWSSWPATAIVPQQGVTVVEPHISTVLERALRGPTLQLEILEVLNLTRIACQRPAPRPQTVFLRIMPGIM